ncbi:MAG: hypothetical protein WBR56_16830 [Sedimenticolaceae bacterium]
MSRRVTIDFDSRAGVSITADHPAWTPGSRQNPLSGETLHAETSQRSNNLNTTELVEALGADVR